MVEYKSRPSIDYADTRWLFEYVCFAKAVIGSNRGPFLSPEAPGPCPGRLAGVQLASGFLEMPRKWQEQASARFAGSETNFFVISCLSRKPLLLHILVHRN